MIKVAVAVFRQKMHIYLAKARGGERILVTSHGTVIAELAPPKLDQASSTDVLARLRDSVLGYDQPLDPVGLADWELLR